MKFYLLIFNLLFDIEKAAGNLQLALGDLQNEK
jgi:hypothetical protein